MDVVYESKYFTLIVQTENGVRKYVKKDIEDSINNMIRNGEYIYVEI